MRLRSTENRDRSTKSLAKHRLSQHPVKDRGKTTELVFYPREGHGLAEYYHQLDRMKREYEWMAKYTLGAGARTAM